MDDPHWLPLQGVNRGPRPLPSCDSTLSSTWQSRWPCSSAPRQWKKKKHGGVRAGNIHGSTLELVLMTYTSVFVAKAQPFGKMPLQGMLGSRCQGKTGSGCDEEPPPLHPCTQSSLCCPGLDSLTFQLFLGKPESLGPSEVHVTTWLFSDGRVTFPDAGNTSPRSIPLLMWLRV